MRRGNSGRDVAVVRGPHRDGSAEVRGTTGGDPCTVLDDDVDAAVDALPRGPRNDGPHAAGGVTVDQEPCGVIGDERRTGGEDVRSPCGVLPETEMGAYESAELE